MMMMMIVVVVVMMIKLKMGTTEFETISSQEDYFKCVSLSLISSLIYSRKSGFEWLDKMNFL